MARRRDTHKHPAQSPDYGRFYARQHPRPQIRSPQTPYVSSCHTIIYTFSHHLQHRYGIPRRPFRPHTHTPPLSHHSLFLKFRPTEISSPQRIFIFHTPHSATTIMSRMPTHHENTPHPTTPYGIPLYELPATIDRPIAIAYLCIAFRENPMRRTLFHAKNSHTEAEPAPYII